MGIQLQMSALAESPEEREGRKRSSTRKRITILASTLLVAILARIILKNPPPPKAPDYTKDEIRYIPGMLDALPAAERAKLDPKVVAKMMQVDEEARSGKTSKDATLLAKGPYKPADPTSENEKEIEEFKQQIFSYAKRKQIEIKKHEIERMFDATKTTLVQFRRGGHLKTMRTVQYNGTVEIRLDKTILARLPKEMVTSITPDALSWEEPIPAGFVKLKPAKGITITVAKETAKRIRVKKEFFDEI